jgi:hypothetical protein
MPPLRLVTVPMRPSAFLTNMSLCAARRGVEGSCARLPHDAAALPSAHAPRVCLQGMRMLVRPRCSRPSHRPEPRILVPSKPEPSTKPFVDGIESMACASVASSLSKHGSPSPDNRAGAPFSVRHTGIAVASAPRLFGKRRAADTTQSTTRTDGRTGRAVADHTADDATHRVLVVARSGNLGRHLVGRVVVRATDQVWCTVDLLPSKRTCPEGRRHGRWKARRGRACVRVRLSLRAGACSACVRVRVVVRAGVGVRGYAG